MSLRRRMGYDSDSDWIVPCSVTVHVLCPSFLRNLGGRCSGRVLLWKSSWDVVLMMRAKGSTTDTGRWFLLRRRIKGSRREDNLVHSSLVSNLHPCPRVGRDLRQQVANLFLSSYVTYSCPQWGHCPAQPRGLINPFTNLEHWFCLGGTTATPPSLGLLLSWK